jgi:hypothetical protein
VDVDWKSRMKRQDRLDGNFGWWMWMWIGRVE